jgi:hypothetical protein
MNSCLVLHLFSRLRKTTLGYPKYRVGAAISIILLWLGTALSSLAATVKIAPDFSPFQGKEIIKVRFLVDGKDVGKLQVDPFALKSDNYAIIERESGKADREIPLDGNPQPRGIAGIQSIFLIPNEDIPVKGKKYVLRVAHSLTIEAPDGSHGVVAPKDYELNIKIAELDREILAPQSVESKFELQTGTGGGAISARYHFRKDQVKQELRDGVTSNDAWLHIDFTAKVDVNVTPKEKNKYLDSMTAELDLFHAYSWPNLPNDINVLPVLMGHSEFGLTSRFETDRDFKTTAATAGAAYSVFVKNPVTTWLHSAFVPKIKEAGVAPFFVVAYDYVSEIRHGAATDKGNNRLRGEFSWSLPLLREQSIPVLGSADADALFEVGGIYDFDKQALTDTTKITLEVRQHEASDQSWSYTLTYGQGKATPTFKHFDAILAGLKKTF